VIEQDVEIRTADGTADGVLCRPDGEGSWPGVIHLTDIGGIRDAHREMVRRLAAKGYTVLMPNVFYRSGRPPMFSFTPTMGEERTMKRFGELAGPLTPEAAERDAAAYVDFLAVHDSAGDGAMGVVGYCFTGSMAMRTAAVQPDKIAAAASRITSCRASRHDFISGTRPKTPACRRKRSTNWIARWRHGVASTKAKSMMARLTDGRCRAARFTTRRKPTARLKS
jgi:dienelactone hydrolase